jgi:ribonuclease Z
MDLSLFFAGTAGSVPSARRGLPALLLRAGGDRLLFDCGEGTQQQLLRSIGLPEIDSVYLTHFHLDHWLGLLGMVKTFDLRARERPLTLYGPPGLRALVESMRPVIGRTGYPLALVELEPHAEVRCDGYVVAAFPVDHRARAYGYAFAEDDRPGRFDTAAARALGIAEGPDFGRLQRGEQVGDVLPEQVVGPVRPGRRIVISGDTRPCQTTEVYAHGADLLVHEATFLEDERVRARETAHSTAAQAAEIARAGRRAAARPDAPLDALLRARRARRGARDLPATVVPRDFDAIDVPFPSGASRGSSGPRPSRPRRPSDLARRQVWRTAAGKSGGETPWRHGGRALGRLDGRIWESRRPAPAVSGRGSPRLFEPAASQCRR